MVKYICLNRRLLKCSYLPYKVPRVSLKIQTKNLKVFKIVLLHTCTIVQQSSLRVPFNALQADQTEFGNAGTARIHAESQHKKQLKGECHEIFCFRFVHESSSPKPLKIMLFSSQGAPCTGINAVYICLQYSWCFPYFQNQ